MRAPFIWQGTNRSEERLAYGRVSEVQGDAFLSNPLALARVLIVREGTVHKLGRE